MRNHNFLSFKVNFSLLSIADDIEKKTLVSRFGIENLSKSKY